MFSVLTLLLTVFMLDYLQILAHELGFIRIGISQIDLSHVEPHFLNWIKTGYHGDMSWMEQHGFKRSRPADLVPGTISIISACLNYFPPNSTDAVMVLNHPEKAYLSRYALGRDYHKVMRKKLAKLVARLQSVTGPFNYRIFTDSAPVLEKPIAIKAGLGWMGKHTNILSREAGSWFFLGEIYTDLVLTETGEVEAHCGRCTACIDICPTQAIIAPYVLDARRCISYLTIEHKGSIPVEFRQAMGNRIYGCDDCQLICPWNRFAQVSSEPDFAIRHQLDWVTLHELFSWSETDFLRKFEGTAIRRIGYERWLRNIAVALGNSPKNQTTIQLLQTKRQQLSSALVIEHIDWALHQQLD